MLSWISSKFRVFDKRKLLFLIFFSALLVKGSTILYFSHLTHCANPETQLGIIATASGDTFSYTGAMENFVSHGTYYFFNGEREVFAGRLPHYSIPYWFFRLFASPSVSHDLLVIVQLLIECSTITLLFNLIGFHCRQKFWALLVILIFLISLHWTNYTYYISPESLSTSFLLLFCIFFIRYLREKKLGHLFKAAMFLGLLVSLKAYFGLTYFLVGFVLVAEYQQSMPILVNLKRIVKKTAIFSIPLILLLTPWAARNYQIFHRFVPLQESLTAGYNYSEADFAYRSFVQAWGGDFVFWEKTSAGCYFEPTPGIKCEFILPDRALADGYTKEDVQEVRDLFVSFQQTKDPLLEKIVTEKFNALTSSYKQRRPADYYVVSRLILAKRFLVHSGSYYLPIHNTNPCFNPWQYAIKGLQSALYWLALLVGFPGLFWLAYQRREFGVFLFLPLLLVILFPLIVRGVEWRMFQGVVPLLLIGFSFGLTLLFKKPSQ